MKSGAAYQAQQARRRMTCFLCVGGLLLFISIWRYTATQQLLNANAANQGKLQQQQQSVPFATPESTPNSVKDSSKAGSDPEKPQDVEQLLLKVEEHLNKIQGPLLDVKKKIEQYKLAKDQVARGVDHTGEETIFVNIASFRDEECPPTLRDMFLKARAPWRVFVGVLQQNDEKDPWCWPPEWSNCTKDVFCPSDQVRIRHISPKDAKGPTYGRFLSHQMYRGEKYYFLIDSHNRFVTHWDDIAIQTLKKAPSYPKAALSHYPEALMLDGSDPKPLDNRDTTTFMCNAKFLPEGFLRFDGLVVHRTEIPRLQPYSAAGMLFGLAEMFKEVPFDPHLPYLFDGEEILYTVRMWTHGYDIYSPNQNIIYHFYYRAKSAKVWSEPNNNWYFWQRRSMERVQWFLGVTHANTTNRIIPADTTADYITIEADKYGLGTVRPLSEYWKFFGIDPIKRTVPNWCSRA